MKFFTKEWYELMQKLDYCICMKPIADGEYTDADIAALYDKCLKKEIAKEKKEYDTPPQFLPIDFDEAELDDFAIFDPEKGVLIKPESIDEVKAQLEEEQARSLAEFESRPPFDESEVKRDFEHSYKMSLEHEYKRFPEEEIAGVDRRLIALGFLPKSVFDRLKAVSKANKREFDRIERAAHKVLRKSAEDISEEISDAFGRLHDARINSIEERGGDLLMTFALDEVPFIDEVSDGGQDENGSLSQGLCITFKSANIIERDDCEPGGDGFYLYDELYKTDDGYEVHMMFECDGLKYLTLSCADIIVGEKRGAV